MLRSRSQPRPNGASLPHVIVRPSPQAGLCSTPPPPWEGSPASNRLLRSAPHKILRPSVASATKLPTPGFLGVMDPLPRLQSSIWVGSPPSVLGTGEDRLEIHEHVHSIATLGDAVSEEIPSNILAKKGTYKTSYNVKSSSWEEDKLNGQLSQHIHGAMSKEDLDSAVTLEREMMAWDEEVIETLDRKNSLESYVQVTKQRLDKHAEDIPYKNRKTHIKFLNDISEWIEADEIDDDWEMYKKTISFHEMTRDLINKDIKECLAKQGSEGAGCSAQAP